MTEIERSQKAAYTALTKQAKKTKMVNYEIRACNWSSEDREKDKSAAVCRKSKWGVQFKAVAMNIRGKNKA